MIIFTHRSLPLLYFLLLIMKSIHYSIIHDFQTHRKDNCLIRPSKIPFRRFSKQFPLHQTTSHFKATYFILKEPTDRPITISFVISKTVSIIKYLKFY